MRTRRRRRALRRHRPRPTPKWLSKSAEIDPIAQQRCLLVLSVLSGEMPVTDAVQAAGMSRGRYYQLETRALLAMLKALGPQAGSEVVETSPQRQIAALEAKVRELERAGRRSQRLLLMTRRVIESRGEKKIASTRSGSAPSRISPKKRAARAASSPPLAGANEP